MQIRKTFFIPPKRFSAGKKSENVEAALKLATVARFLSVQLTKLVKYTKMATKYTNGRKYSKRT
jgi:hypothetical protein